MSHAAAAFNSHVLYYVIRGKFHMTSKKKVNEFVGKKLLFSSLLQCDLKWKTDLQKYFKFSLPRHVVQKKVMIIGNVFCRWQGKMQLLHA